MWLVTPDAWMHWFGSWTNFGVITDFPLNWLSDFGPLPEPQSPDLSNGIFLWALLMKQYLRIM